MKKLLLSSVLLVTLFVTFTYALPAAAPTVAANKYMSLIAQKSNNWDTLAGVDSAVFASMIQVPTGDAYILNRGAITGGGADSVLARVVVDAYNYDPTSKAYKFAYRTEVDTFTTASGTCPGEQIAIPFYDSIFGDKFTIKIISTSGAGAGGVQILNNMKLSVRKLYIESKNVAVQ